MPGCIAVGITGIFIVVAGVAAGVGGEVDAVGGGVAIAAVVDVTGGDGWRFWHGRWCCFAVFVDDGGGGGDNDVVDGDVDRRCW